MAGEKNDDNEIRQIRRVNQITRHQAVRLVQMAVAALGVCSQLKGCSSASGAGIPVEYLHQDTTMAIFADAVDGWVTLITHGIVTMVFTMIKLVTFTLGCSILVAGFAFLVLGPLTWLNSILVRWFERRCAPYTMGWRYRLMIKPSLQLAKWLLGQEIVYLRARFRAAGQRGDMMIDIESIHHDLEEYLGGERIRLDVPRQAGEPQHPNVQLDDEVMEGEEEEGGDDDDHPPDDPSDEGGNDPNGDEIVNAVLNGVPLNGQTVNQPPNHDYEDEDEEMPEETVYERRRRYLNSGQDEVSDPDEWADIHYGNLEFFDYDRMIAFSRANQIRLRRAADTLRGRHDAAATEGNWAEAAVMLRALREVEELMNVA
eukprot:s975_g21.t1